MSQIVTIKRRISIENLSAALEQIESLSLGAEHSWGFAIDHTVDPNSFITYSNGEVEATSPSEELLQELEGLASLLDAERVLEDDVALTPSTSTEPWVRETVVFWPVLVLVLILLLL